MGGLLSYVNLVYWIDHLMYNSDVCTFLQGGVNYTIYCIIVMAYDYVC